jgi:peptide/nickel transport system ATP-binding protein
MTDTAPRLEVRDLRVEATPAGPEVVAEVSFALGSGESLGLVGESGSGKTTVALALLGHARQGLRISGGRVLVGGSDILRLSDRETRRLRGGHVAYVPQDPATALNPALKVGAQLDEMLRKAPAADAPARKQEVLEEVSLDARVVGSYPHQLSGGQQQRVALAMAFALRPGVIVLDEPTTGLDVTTQRRVIDTIRSLCASHGVAAVFVSHDLAVVSELVDQVAVMYAGRIVEQGACETVFGTAAHPYTRALLRAVPATERSVPLIGLAGQPPRPGYRPRGCSFAPRCELAIDDCRAGEPAPRPVDAPEHRVRCIRTGEVPAAMPLVPHAIIGARVEEELLRVTGLAAAYGDAQVVHDVSLAVARHECVAVVGESGSGKTTLARCIVGLHRQWSGQMTWQGAELRPGVRGRAREALRSIQYVFQNPYSSLNPRRQIADIVRQPLDRLGLHGRSERRDRVVAALVDASLDETFLERYPAELSGGERQRVAIARALVVEPELLVCDEITSALDVSVQASIVETLRRLQHERGLGLLFITHNLALVRSIAQRVTVMQAGRVVESGACGELLDHPQCGYTQTLLRDLPRPELIAVG